MSTEQHNNGLLLGRDEAKHKDILAATVVALKHGLSEGGVPMEGYLFVPGMHQVVHNVATWERNLWLQCKWMVRLVDRHLFCPLPHHTKLHVDDHQHV